LPLHLRRRIKSHENIIDKHGEEHPVSQILSDDETSPLVARSPDIQALILKSRSPSVLNYDSIDSLIIIQMIGRKGIPATAIDVQRVESKEFDAQTGLPRVYEQYVAPYRELVKKELRGDNRDKVWICEFKSNFSDRRISLKIARTDYLTHRCLEKAFDSGLATRFEQEGRVHDDLPNLCGTCSFVVTDDDYLILAQRKHRQTDFADGNWSPSFEEQWDWQKDKLPYEVVLRGLEEEFGIAKERGIHIGSENIRLVAFGREWGRYWAPNLVFFVRAPASAQTILNCWSANPPPIDKNEHGVVAAVPLRTGSQFLLNLLEGESLVDETELEQVCGMENIKRAYPSDRKPHSLHPTTGRARVILALWAMGYLGDQIRVK
jgi:hypothetical protein